MSEHRCLDPEGLSGHESWPEDDPRLVHLLDCARCQALLASYRLFDAVPDDLPLERRNEARVHLANARLAWHESGPERLPAPGRPASSPLGRVTQWFGRPRYRVALAFAALVVVAGAFYQGRVSWVGWRPAPVLRAQGEAPGGASISTVTLLAPRWESGHRVLAWRAVHGADTYEVTLLDAGFSAVSHRATGRDTVLDLVSAQMGSADAISAPVYWQVRALRSGDLVAESSPALLGPARRR